MSSPSSSAAATPTSALVNAGAAWAPPASGGRTCCHCWGCCCDRRCCSPPLCLAAVWPLDLLRWLPSRLAPCAWTGRAIIIRCYHELLTSPPLRPPGCAEQSQGLPPSNISRKTHPMIWLAFKPRWPCGPAAWAAAAARAPRRLLHSHVQVPACCVWRKACRASAAAWPTCHLPAVVSCCCRCRCPRSPAVCSIIRVGSQQSAFRNFQTGSSLPAFRAGPKVTAAWGWRESAAHLLPANGHLHRALCWEF
jgi:hypothetical protein